MGFRVIHLEHSVFQELGGASGRAAARVKPWAPLPKGGCDPESPMPLF